MKTIIHSDIQIGWPDKWTDISTVVLVGPPNVSFSPNITITRDTMNATKSSAEYATEQLLVLRREFGEMGYEVSEEGPLRISENLSAYQRVHSFVLPDSGLQVRQWQVYATKAQEAITITCSDKLDTFEASKAVFQVAVSQFAFR
jgi:hypothetical protein